MNLSVVQRTLISFLVLFSFIVILTSISLVNINKLNGQLNQTVDQLAPKAEQTNRLSSVLLNISRLVSLHAITEDTQERAALKEKVNSLITTYHTIADSLSSKAGEGQEYITLSEQISSQAQSLFDSAEQQFLTRENWIEANQQQNQLADNFMQDWEFFSFDIQSVIDSTSAGNKWMVEGLKSDGELLGRTVEKALFSLDKEQQDTHLLAITSHHKSMLTKQSQLIAAGNKDIQNLDQYYQLAEDATGDNGLLASITKTSELLALQNQNLTNISQTVELTLPMMDDASQLVVSELEAAKAMAEETSQNANVQLLMLVGISVIISSAVIWSIIANIRRSLKRIMGQIEKLVAGDFTQSVSVSSTDEFGQISHHLNTLNEQLDQIIGAVVTNTQELATGADTGMRSSQETRSLIGEQKLEIEQTAIAFKDMNLGIHEVSGLADTAQLEIEKVVALAVQGQSDVKVTHETVISLRDGMKQAVEKAHHLKTQSADISGILDVIRGIADQTNLLALNAAIEAARAGEQGRGFAVVADEVRVLAGRTQEATVEILSVIQGLQESSGEAVTIMENGDEMATLCYSQTEKNDIQLQNIAELLLQVQTNSAQIAETAQDKMHVAEQVDNNMKAIVALGESTVEEAIKNSEVSQKLLQQSEEQSQQVASFKLRSA